MADPEIVVPDPPGMEDYADPDFDRYSYDLGYREGHVRGSREAFAGAADYVGEMLHGFIDAATANSPEWDRAQAKILGHVERWLRDQVAERGES